MINRKKLILGLILISVVVFSLAQAAELEYPEAEQEATTTLGGYVSYIYNFSLMVAGFIIFAVLIYAGFRYLTSAGNPAAMKSAKKQILGAFVGLVILLTSYLILVTINPDLVNLPGGPGQDSKFKPNKGICFYNADDERLCYVKSSKSFPKDFEATKVEFMSPVDELYTLYLFSNEGWKNVSDTLFNIKEDPDQEYKVGISSPKSFFIDWNDPGVWLFTRTHAELDFPDDPRRIYQTSIADLDDYNNRVESILLMPKCSNETPTLGPYGAVLHSEPNFEGTSTIILIDGSDPCSSHQVNNLKSKIINYNTSSVTVFEHSYEENDEGSVTFYDRGFFQGDRFKVSANTIGNHWHANFDNGNDYPVEGSVEGATITNEGAALDNKKIDRIMSLKIDGNYLVVLSSTANPEQEKEFKQPSEVIFGSDPNLSTNYVLGGRETEKGTLGRGYKKIQSISIIPIQEPVTKPSI